MSLSDKIWKHVEQTHPKGIDRSGDIPTPFIKEHNDKSKDIILAKDVKKAVKEIKDILCQRPQSNGEPCIGGICIVCKTINREVGKELI